MHVTDCRSCGAAIVFLETATGRKIPVDADTVTDGDTLFEPRAGHVSHFASCPEAASWRQHGSCRSATGVAMRVAIADIEVGTRRREEMGDAAEHVYRDALAAMVRGATEVVLSCGRIDVLTETTVYEVTHARLWKQALGQALVYASELDRKPAIALFGLDRDDDQINRIDAIAQQLDVELVHLWQRQGRIGVTWFRTPMDSMTLDEYRAFLRNNQENAGRDIVKIGQQVKWGRHKFGDQADLDQFEEFSPCWMQHYIDMANGDDPGFMEDPDDEET